MRKLIFILLILFSYPSICLAENCWGYFRLENRSAITEKRDASRSKRGDMVTCLPITAQYVPTEEEKSEWAIVKIVNISRADIRDYTSEWWVDQKRRSYRRHTINASALRLKKGLNRSAIDFSEIKRRSRKKTDADLAYYKKLRDRERVLVAIKRPFIKMARVILPHAFAETISTINKSGEDYNTCTLWEDAKDGDLVTETRQETGDLYDDDGDLTDQCAISGSTTSSAYFMRFNVPSGERHDGTAGTGAKITKALTGTSGQFVITNDDHYTEIFGVEVVPDFGSDSRLDESGGINSTVSHVKIQRTIVHPANLSNLDGFSNNITGIRTADNDNTVTTVEVSRNIVYGFDHSTNDFKGISLQVSNFRKGDMDAFYNTTFGNDYGFHTSAGGSSTVNADFRGNRSSGNSQADFTFNGSITYTANDYNCSEDTTATGANSSNDCSDSDYASVTAGSEDLHLVRGAEGINAGVDLGTTPSGVELDIDWRDVDAEADTWDIGADEFTAGAAPVYTPKAILISKYFGPIFNVWSTN